jgi:hypothetical protein
MRVPDEIKQCVVFLGCAKADSTAVFVGSAWFFANDTATPPLGCLITARHVIERIKDLGVAEVMVRVNTKSGTAVWTNISFDRWILPNPGSDLDVAIACVGIPNSLDHHHFPRSLVLTPELANELDIGVGEEVFITGLFANHTGDIKNGPIVRVGNLASYPAEEIQTSFGRMDAFLIEARSIGGLSGSPVFVHIGNVRVVEGQLKTATKPVYYLAGLIHGHYDQMMATGTSGGQRDSVNTDIAIVVPIENTLSFLDQKKSMVKGFQ